MPIRWERCTAARSSDPGGRLTRWLRPILAVVVVVVCYGLILPSFASYRQIIEQLGSRPSSVPPVTVILLIVVAAINLIAPSLSQMAALPSLSLRQAVWTDWATTAVTNVLPGGSALAIGLTWTMYRSFGLTSTAIARSVMVTGVWDTMVKLGTPMLALAWLSTQRPVSPTLIQAAVVGAVLFAVAVALTLVVLAGPGPARTVGRLVDRLPKLGHGWSRRLNQIRTDTVELLARRGFSLTLWTVVGHANLYLLLVLCLRVVGVERSILGFAPVLAAFAFGRLVTAIPITPGGLGVMEVGLTGALGAVGQADTALVVAAVLLFRLLTFAVPTVLGTGGYLWWQLRRSPDGNAGSVLASQAQHDVE